MERNQILAEIKKYFSIEELVCNHAYDKWRNNAWQFLDTGFLHALLVIRRDILKSPMTCNSDDAKQRGLRCNRCDLVKSKQSVYLSAHILGKAGDFTVSGMTAEEARQKIKASALLLPCNVRIEGGVSWLHIDTLPQSGIIQKVYEFKV
jgi:hypothetical protein